MERAIASDRETKRNWTSKQNILMNELKVILWINEQLFDLLQSVNSVSDNVKLTWKQ